MEILSQIIVFIPDIINIILLANKYKNISCLPADEEVFYYRRQYLNFIGGHLHRCKKFMSFVELKFNWTQTFAARTERKEPKLWMVCF